ncbi:initiation factor 2 [Hypoxylon trugodes]|uniref:initiation factor 2 n=1 Tax=Hypoxylon trugodes TaxID=326681 RepID=UPI00219F8518|nr:initiation factor 2 [Hypoxylon trugodes]KAI1385190.1 initiation factor 2 [Hypoxylon trugodes]
MLRAGISGRESSICAFCQHRLSLRFTTPRTSKKQFSTTKPLKDDDDWGWGNHSKPQAQPKQDDFLNQRELLARRQLLAKQQQKSTPEPPKPNPADSGVQARHVWDAGKQREIETSLRREGVTFQREAHKEWRDRSPFQLAPRLRDVGQGSTFIRRPPGTLARETREANTIRPNDFIKGVFPQGISQTPNNNDLNGRGARESRSLGSNQFFKEPPRSTPTNFDSPFGDAHRNIESKPTNPRASPFTPPEKDPDWSSLARKQTPKSSDFWNHFGNEFKNNSKSSQATKTQGSNDLRTASSRSDSKNTWEQMEKKVADPKSSGSKALYDWGEEFDTSGNQIKNTSKSPPSRASTTDTPSRVLEEQSQARDFGGRDRGRGRGGRTDRFETFEQRDSGAADRGKRSRRGAKFGLQEDDGADFDYEQYQERRRAKAARKAQRESEKAGPTPISLPELISIEALAEALKVKPKTFLKQLGELGFENVSLDSLMAGDTAALVAQEYGFEPTVEVDRDLKPRPPPEDVSVLPQRPPVVTIMGHVDHGKTTLLDYLRNSSIAAQEHGGITQRIGAFSVKLSGGKQITFLDTPGHAAFLTMRQRGAYVTDIVVLVVAADDSVKPQTIEAIKHARGAKVPIIVAINKIDKEGARIDQVKSDLAREGIEIEDFGGDVQVVCVSGKTGQGMDDLEENILTLSEILDHRAEIDGLAEGWVLESSLKPIGKAATILVKRGTLRPGDIIAAGLTWARIRHLRNEAGVEIDEAPPGTAVEILGWKDLPAAGDQVLQAENEGRAKDATEYREGLRDREKDAAAHEGISEARRVLQEKRAREKSEAGADEALPEEENGTRMVNVVVKGDLHGSVEAVCAAVQELGNHEVQPRILRSGTGAIGEFDVEHAATSNSVIVNFATTTPGYIKAMAEEQGVKILDHNVIYHLVDDVKAVLSEYLTPEISSRVLGEAEVLQVFPINLKGRVYKNVAGCRVRNGVVARTNLYRIFRDGKKIFDGKLETLKHVKKDVTEMRKGTECGIGFEEFQDIKVGDQIQAYEEVKTKRFL